MQPRPFVLTIDVEPDVRELDPSRRDEWEGFRRVHAWMEELRPRLAARTGRRVTLNWFLRMDPQIAAVYGSADWVTRRFGRELEALAAEGDVLGLHTHAFRWEEETGRWVSDHGAERWTARCVDESVAAFRSAWGRPPRAFRFGDRWLSDRVVARLARLGVRYDLTVEPGVASVPGMVPAERSTGALPDYRRAPRFPYRPSRSDFLVPGRGLFRRRLWMLPVSTGCVNGPARPAEADPRHEFCALNLGLHPRWIGHLLDGLLESEPVVVSVARTGDAAGPEGRARLLENLERLATHPALAGRTFTTPAGALASRSAPR
ncbi:MAG TPA: hypothetical protein VMN04_01780 [Thermoanaerobaculia bacterium]|nr:hypothetical protein [Thermoanaerobaculia bacterium]